MMAEALPGPLENTAGFSSAAAELTARVMRKLAPDVWPEWEPFADRLFTALAQGDTCIRLSSSECAHVDSLIRSPSFSEAFPKVLRPFVLRGNRLFFARMAGVEDQIACEFFRLAAVPVKAPLTNAVRPELDRLFPGSGDVPQRLGAAMVLTRRMLLVNGGPGTGKTTLTAKLLGLLCRFGGYENGLPRIALTAPTGKAAAHMMAALQRAVCEAGFSEDVRTHLLSSEAMTVHRLLGLRPPLGTPSYYREHTLPADIVVVDEVSMMDLSLFGSLLSALKTGTRLILLGDAGQLPAVGVGNVLADLSVPTEFTAEDAAALSALLPEVLLPESMNPPVQAACTVTLTHSHRFDSDSGIGRLASAVRAGDGQAALDTFRVFQKELSILPPNTSSACQALYEAQRDYWQAVDANDREGVFRALKSAVVLTVLRRDAESFNSRYCRYLTAEGRPAAESVFPGLPVLVTGNDYGLGVFNGDVGVMLPDDEGMLQVYFSGEGGLRRFLPGRLPAHEPAFAVTVHKSQGSEYGTVFLWVPDGPGMEGHGGLFDRTLLYTALTRARTRFVFYGGSESFSSAAAVRRERLSGLHDALQTAFRVG